MLIKDTCWSDNFVLHTLKYRGLPYNRVDTTDAIEHTFNTLCTRHRITCEWFPYAGAISAQPEHLSLLSVLRGHAIESVEQKLLASAR